MSDETIDVHELLAELLEGDLPPREFVETLDEAGLAVDIRVVNPETGTILLRSDMTG